MVKVIIDQRIHQEQLNWIRDQLMITVFHSLSRIQQRYANVVSEEFLEIKLLFNNLHISNCQRGNILLQAKHVDDLRQKLRMRGLRCHLMYCSNSKRLQVIPLLASRSQALRYVAQSALSESKSCGQIAVYFLSIENYK